MRLIDRLEDFAFPSLSTSLYCSYTVRVTAMLADMVDIFAKQYFYNFCVLYSFTGQQ